MTAQTATAVLWLTFAQMLPAHAPAAVEKAAAKYDPGVTWQARSIVSGNFTCRGRKEQAILGTSPSHQIVVRHFRKRTHLAPPALLRYPARNPKTAELTVEDLDYNPRQDIGYDLEGFQPSKVCKGLNLSDGLTDSAHIYWNRKAHRFEDWTL